MAPVDEPNDPMADAVRVMPLERTKGLEFSRVYVIGLHAGALPGPAPAGPPVVPEGVGSGTPSHEDDARRLLYIAMTRATEELVLTRPAGTEAGAARPSPFYEDARAVLDAGEQEHGEELFGPAEGLQATYRMIQDEVLEEAWRAGGKLREPRLDTYVDVTRAVGRFLELVKLAGADPGVQRGAGGRLPGGDQRPSRPGDLTRAARGSARLRPRRLPARRGGSGKAAARADRTAR